jgi:cyclophilin family peptidyl-prolyl cis-trans isomerase
LAASIWLLPKSTSPKIYRDGALIACQKGVFWPTSKACECYRVMEYEMTDWNDPTKAPQLPEAPDFNADGEAVTPVAPVFTTVSDVPASLLEVPSATATEFVSPAFQSDMEAAASVFNPVSVAPDYGQAPEAMALSKTPEPMAPLPTFDAPAESFPAESFPTAPFIAPVDDFGPVEAAPVANNSAFYAAQMDDAVTDESLSQFSSIQVDEQYVAPQPTAFAAVDSGMDNAATIAAAFASASAMTGAEVPIENAVAAPNLTIPTLKTRKAPALGLLAILASFANFLPMGDWLHYGIVGLVVVFILLAFKRRESKVVALTSLLFTGIAYFSVIPGQEADSAVITAVAPDFRKDENGVLVPQDVLCNEPLTSAVTDEGKCSINNVSVACEVVTAYRQSQKLSFCPAGSLNAAPAVAVAAPVAVEPAQAAVAPTKPASIWDLCGQIIIQFGETGSGDGRVCSMSGITVPCSHHDYYKAHPQTPFYCGQK